MTDNKILKVSKSTDPKKLAGTIKYNLLKGTNCELLALGQQPICNSVKALALLTTMFSFDYTCKMEYFNQTLSDGMISGIKFSIKNNF